MSPSDTPREFADFGVLKALANPLRQKIMERLALEGPATSTMLAHALKVTSGATSYNLRVLAEHGFVREVPERGRGRERWWRIVGRDLRLPVGSSQDGETQAAAKEVLRLWFATDLETFDTYLREGPDTGEWAGVMPYSRGAIQVTSAGLAAFFEDYIELIKRYQASGDDVPPGARTVLTRFLAFPAPTDRNTASDASQDGDGSQ
jgi:DNA-binding transcriptional ArsR family regulator